MTTAEAPASKQSPRGAASTVLRTEAALFGRELGSLFWIVLFPTMLLLIIGLVPDFTEPDEALGGQRFVDVYASVVVHPGDDHGLDHGDAGGDRGLPRGGVLRRLRTTPMHPAALLVPRSACTRSRCSRHSSWRSARPASSTTCGCPAASAGTPSPSCWPLPPPSRSAR